MSNWSSRWRSKVGGPVRQACDVATRALETFDQFGADRIAGRRKDNRYALGRFLGGEDRIGARRDDDIDLAVDELFGELRVAVFLPLRPAIFDRDVTAVDPAPVAQAPLEGFHERAPNFMRGCTKETDSRLLRPTAVQARLARCHLASPTTASPRGVRPRELKLGRPSVGPRGAGVKVLIAFNRNSLAVIMLWLFVNHIPQHNRQPPSFITSADRASRQTHFVTPCLSVSSGIRYSGGNRYSFGSSICRNAYGASTFPARADASCSPHEAIRSGKKKSA